MRRNTLSDLRHRYEQNLKLSEKFPPASALFECLERAFLFSFVRF